MSNSIDIPSIRKSINNALWDEAISVVGKFMNNNKIYGNIIHSLYEAHQQYGTLKDEINHLNKQADELQTKLEQQHANRLSSLKNSKGKRGLLIAHSNLQQEVKKIQKLRDKANELNDQLTSQSFLSLYQQIIKHKKALPQIEANVHSDYKYFTRSLHYNFATSNRDEVGNESTAAIGIFWKYKDQLGPAANLTYKLLEVYSAFANAAADKEKCFWVWHKPIDNKTYLNYISETKSNLTHSKKPFAFIEYLQGQHEDIFGNKMPPENTITYFNMYYDRLYVAYQQLNEFSKIIQNCELATTLEADAKAELFNYHKLIEGYKARCNEEINNLSKFGIIGMEKFLQADDLGQAPHSAVRRNT
jgi:hypothetical protein